MEIYVHCLIYVYDKVLNEIQTQNYFIFSLYKFALNLINLTIVKGNIKSEDPDIAHLLRMGTKGVQ
jgi:hypothetical protein